MQHMIPLIRKIAQRIAETESRRMKLAEFVKQISPDLKLKQPVAPDPLKNRKIVAVDGGLVKKSLHGMDCMLVRAAGVCFHYNDSKVSDVKYFPSRNPTPRPEMYEALSEIDWNYFSSINRLKEEIGTAIASLEEFKPDLLLLDGLILPHYLDRPARTSPLYPSYKELLLSYRSLFSRVRGSGSALAGVIEDSRNCTFCDYLSTTILSKVRHAMVPELKSLLRKTRDSNLLYLILEKGERTLSFPLNASPTFDFDIPPMKTFYLKTAKFDRPLKVDFITQGIDADSLASILMAISGHHSGYGLPTPLIEADNVAKLSELEMDHFYNSILSLTGGLPTVMKLRREQRPF